LVQLPSERELGGQFDVSRSSLREALKILAQHKLIEARPGVGWFVLPLEGSKLIKARELAQAERVKILPKKTSPSADPPPGPRRLPVAKEKPLKIPNLQTDRLGTFDFISWWERDKVADAKVLVVGAGALGNEVVKNLTLMGVGHILVIDFDTIEYSNLSRSVLFRESDAKRKKSQVVAARAKELNPQTKIQYLHGDVTTELGLGVVRRMDVVIRRYSGAAGPGSGLCSRRRGLLRMHFDRTSPPRSGLTLLLPVISPPECLARKGAHHAHYSFHHRGYAVPGSPEANP